jgi:hypothetical protein
MIVSVNQNVCGQVNNSFPKGCQDTTFNTTKCATYYSVNPGSYPCSYPLICTNGPGRTQTPCGAQQTTCQQN